MQIIGKSKTKKDYIYTFITEFVVLCASILVYKFSANILGEEGFSIYALTRRTISFILPLTMIGLGVALPRHIAFNIDNKKDINTLLISAFVLFLLSSFLLLIWFVCFNRTFATLFFENPDYYYLIFPLILYIFGLGFNAIVYGYFRGRLLMVNANVLQLLNIGFIPILAFLFFNNLFYILLFSAVSTFIIASIFIYPSISFKDYHYNSAKSYVKKLFNYGIRRTPGDIVLSAYFALPAYIITHQENIIIGGYVAFSITLINIFGSTFTPISLILLPQASIIIKQGKLFKLRSIFKKLSLLALGVSFIGIIIIQLFISEIITIYLGSNYLPSVNIIRIIILGSFGYTLFIALRSILDAYYEKAINTYNITYSFCFMCLSFLFVYFFNVNYYIILWFFVFSMNLLGLLTLFKVLMIVNK